MYESVVESHFKGAKGCSLPTYGNGFSAYVELFEWNVQYLESFQNVPVEFVNSDPCNTYGLVLFDIVCAVAIVGGAAKVIVLVTMSKAKNALP